METTVKDASAYNNTYFKADCLSVLIVGGEKGFGNMLRTILTNIGMNSDNITVTTELEAAADYLRSDAFDVMMTSEQFDDDGGMKLFRFLWQEQYRTPIFVFSSRPTPDFIEHATVAGISDVLALPISTKVVRGRLSLLARGGYWGRTPSRPDNIYEAASNSERYCDSRTNTHNGQNREGGRNTPL